MKRSVFFLPLLCVCGFALAQDTIVYVKGIPQKVSRDSQYISNNAFTKLLNRSFSQVAVGPTNGSNLSNYASFEPVNGAFAFNGFSPIFAGKDTSKRMSFVNFSIKGNINGANVGALFSNSKLNSSVSVNLKYHFALHKPVITYDEKDKYSADEGKSKFRDIEIAQLEQLNRGLIDLDYKLQAHAWKIQALEKKISKDENALTVLRKTTAGIAASNPDSAVYNKLADSCLSNYQKIQKLYVELAGQRSKRDSLKRLQVWISSPPHIKDAADGHVRYFINDISNAIRDKRVELEVNNKLSNIQFGWMSLNVQFNKQKYYTYDQALPFNVQINESTLNAFNVGLTYNFYKQNLDNNYCFYFNVGINRLKTSNVEDLTPIDVSDEKEVIEAPTKRKSVTKYNAFTSPVEAFKAWQLYVNLYYLFGKQNVSGLHFFPEVNFRSTNNNVLNLGVGYVVSFKDKKDKSIINAEAYVKFSDVGNSLQQEMRFYKRNEIGVSFGIPFNAIISTSK
jgi:hypothetical protein